MKDRTKLKTIGAAVRRELPFLLCVAAATTVILLASADPSYAQGQYDEEKFGEVCNKVFAYLEGGFGALLAAVAGIGAIIASAAGGFRLAWALVVVSIGAFIVKEYNGIFFQGGCG